MGCSFEVMVYFSVIRENRITLGVLEHALNSYGVALARKPRLCRSISNVTGSIGRDATTTDVPMEYVPQVLWAKDEVASEDNTSLPQSALGRETSLTNNGNECDMSGANACFVCMSNGASFVMSACGHYGVCNACRRSLVHRRLVGENIVADTKKARQYLKNKELERTQVLCPLCRTEGRVIAIDRYNGDIYKCDDATN